MSFEAYRDAAVTMMDKVVGRVKARLGQVAADDAGRIISVCMGYASAVTGYRLDVAGRPQEVQEVADRFKEVLARHKCLMRTEGADATPPWLRKMPAL